MSDPNSTAHFPSLDAWKRTQAARDSTVEFLHKDTLKHIQGSATLGKDTFVLRLSSNELQYEVKGRWIWRTATPTGRLKRLIEMFQADGFLVKWDQRNSNLIISWNLDQ